jgi:protein required for attachment to host cells
MEPHHDFHNFEKRMFARQVAKLLDEHAGKHAIERLVIVAPPKTLGDLRAELSSHTSALVAAEVAKDLTHVPVTQILDHLRDVPQF